MRKLLLASAAISAVTLGLAQAQETPVPAPGAPAAGSATDVDNNQTQSTSPNVDAGVAVGGTAGAVAGAVVGGPVGAVIGGFAGAMIGSAAAVPAPAVDYVVANPVQPVMVQGGVREGMVLPADAMLTPIPDHADYAYVYVDGRPVIVRNQTREIVYSPGYVVPQQTVTYVQANPTAKVALNGMTVGSVIPAGIELVKVPSDPAYAYVYTDSGPVLVNTSSRTVVWIDG
ncbi:MAG: DUF1236 domain-containing protein [Mesorhizobium sp.]|nr:DUF1236 domain-containing protein [Mesorhizobium sp.]